MNSTGNFDNQNTKYLYTALAALETPEEAAAFLQDVCTIAELTEMANRISVAKMLCEGMTYQQICDATGISTATVTRVNRCLRYGSGGYKLIIDRLEKDGE